MTSNITKNFKAKSALRKEHGGDVKGPGGPTEDKVGPVALSDGEYVLPADTVAAVGVENLDKLRAATHDFDSTKDAEGLAGGGVVDWIKGAAGAAAERARNAMSSLRGATPATPAPANAAPSTATQSSGVLRVNPGAGVSPRTPTGTGMVPEAVPGRAMVPYQPAPTPAASSAPGAAYRAGRALRGLGRVAGGLRGLAGGVATTAPIAGFGDYKADTGGVDTSAAGSFGYLRRGEFGNFGTSLSGGAAEALADSARGVTKTIDGIAGIVGADPGLTRKLDSAITGGYLSLRNPDSSDVTGGVQARQSGPAPAAAPQSATPVANVLGRSAMADEANQRAPYRSPYAGQDADLRGAGAYQGALENRSGLPNSDPRINGSTSAAYNALGDDAVVGSFNGRSVTKKEADARAAGLPTASSVPQKPAEDPIMGEIRSALRGSGGSRGGGSSFSGRDSGTDDINQRYDAMLRDGAGQNRVRGLDWSQRHGLDVEQARAKELGDYAQNQSTLRGQDNAASIAADQNRTQLANTLLGIQAQREKAALDARSAMANAQSDAAKAAEARDEQGLTDIREAVRARFGEDSALAESTLSRILSAGQDQVGRVTSLTGQDRAAAIEDLLDSASAAQSFDDQQSSLWGNTDSGLPRATETRDPRFFRDVFAGGNRALPALGRELKDLVGLDARVMVDDNGRVAPLSDDLRQRRTQRRAEEDAPRRSRLRNDN